MKKILLLIPYFGEFPNYFSLWLKSVSYNQSIDFLLVTDADIEMNIPQNLRIVKMTFNELKSKIQNIFPFKVYIPEPYRLCGFRPAYGYIFSEYIAGYDYWGYCDMDLIFGDLRTFLTDYILSNYDKILSHGHLTIFRNCEEMNDLFKIKRNDCLNYKQSFTSKHLLSSFDEYPLGISRIAKMERVKVYEKMIFADLDMFFFTFRKLSSYLDEEDDSEDIIQFFKWSTGKLFDIVMVNNTRNITECAYVHFQKRDMDVSRIEYIGDEFIIVPNKFLDEADLSDEQIFSICDLSLNDEYCANKQFQLKTNKKVSLFHKVFSVSRWRRRIFKFKMEKIHKIMPYKFLKGGF